MQVELLPEDRRSCVVVAAERRRLWEVFLRTWISLAISGSLRVHSFICTSGDFRFFYLFEILFISSFNEERGAILAHRFF